MRGWDYLGHVAGFRTWLALGRYVRKGERGLSVLAPVRVKVTAEDGSESWALRGFKVEHVFAARQTEGEGEIPEPIRPKLLSGEGPAGACAAGCLNWWLLRASLSSVLTSTLLMEKRQSQRGS